MAVNTQGVSLGRTSFKTIEADIRKQIASKELLPGERLQSCRELASKYSCSVNTVEKALSNLENSGFVLKEKRKGVTVSPEVTVKEGSKLVVSFVVSIDNPLWASAQRGIEDYLHNIGFSMISASHDLDSEKCRQTLQNLRNVKVDGVIIAPIDHSEEMKAQFTELIQGLLDRGIKVVLMDRNLHTLELPYVTTDNIIASYKITRLLIENGHRRIGFVRTSRVSTVEERFSGFKQAGFEAGLSDDEMHDFMIKTEHEDFKEEIESFCERLAAELIEHPVTALFASNDQIFKSITRTLKAMNLSVPADISLVSYDVGNIQQHYPYKITGVKQNFYGMGKLAAELLIDCIYAESGKSTLRLGHVFPADIITGSSVAPPKE